MAKKQRQGPGQRQRRRRKARRTRQRVLRVRKERSLRTRDYFSRIHHDKTVNELEGASVAADEAKTNVYTNGNTVNHEAALIMFDTEVSVNVCSSWLGEPALEQLHGSVRFRGADGRTNTPRVRKATDLVENRKSAETIKSSMWWT